MDKATAGVVQGPRVHRPPQLQAQQRRAARPTPALWHAQHLVGRFPTELWGLQATTQPARVQLLVVPGNPGLASFYAVFLQRLHAAFRGTADVTAVSHVGHDADNISSGRVWGLQDQVQHKVQLLREVVLGPGRPPAVILAHSIGSYIMLQALQQLEQQHEAATGQHMPGVLKVFLLMPFLACNFPGSHEQRILAAAARTRHNGLLTAAAAAIHGGPAWLQDGAAALLAPGAEPHAAACLKAAFDPAAFRNNWHMAAEEFRSLDAPVDWRLVSRLGSRVAVVYNPRDPWFQQYGAMREAVPGIEEYAHAGLGHAFCLSTGECGVVADNVQRSVATAMQPDQGDIAAAAARTPGLLLQPAASG